MDQMPAAIPGLPVYLTSLLGRDEDIARVRDLLRTPSIRLVTITGFGGIGKTRLATAVASGMTSEWRRIWFVSLAHIHETAAATSLIARELEIEDNDARANRAVRHDLQSAPCLLVLDNFEHLVDAADEVSTLLQTWPLLTILITSRAPLRLSGEQVYTLLPLSTRIDGHSGSAVQLFVERARAHVRGFQLTPDNESIIRQICQHLEGIPLAIELAAARIALLTPATMLEHLSSQLTLLTGGPRDAPARQRTLRDTIVWSYELLDQDERETLQGLSVFSGGFTMEAASSVLNLPSSTMMEHLGALVDGSIVLAAPSPLIPTMRYRLLDPVREFAFELLTARGRAREMQLAHARFYTMFAEAALPLYDGPELSAILRATCVEIDNFRTAMAWSLQSGNREDGVRLAGAIWRNWQSLYMGMETAWSDRVAEGRRWITLALSRAEGLPLNAVREAIIGNMRLAANSGDITNHRSRINALRNRAIAENDDYALWWAETEQWRSAIDLPQPIADADQVLDRLIALSRRIRQPENQMAAVYLMMSDYLWFSNQRTSSDTILLRGVDMAFRSGNPLFMSFALRMQGDRMLQEGDHTSAFYLLRQAIGLQESVDLQVSEGDYAGLPEMHTPFARIAMRTGRPDLATPLLTTPPPIFGDDFDLLEYQEALAEFHSLTGESIAPEASNEIMSLSSSARNAILDALEAHLASIQQDATLPSLLSPRETEVLRLVARGTSNRAIANALFISERTAENHVQHILSKLNVPNRAGAAAWAVRHDLA